MYRPDIQLVVILSLPRSGSTALAAELDRYQGVVAVPETYFPGAVEFAEIEGIDLSGCLAGLFLECSDAGSPLSFAELTSCMYPGDWRRTLIDIGLLIAARIGRNTDDVTAVVYKTTRLVSFTKLLQKAAAKFIVLRRDPRNVFESQFRVSFGVHNRNPLRFAFFMESYEACFATLPKGLVTNVEYGRIPSVIVDILGRIANCNRLWPNTASSHELVAEKAWHAGLLRAFHNDDDRKRSALSASRKVYVGLAVGFARLFRPLLRGVRRRRDRQLARRLLRGAGCVDE